MNYMTLIIGFSIQIGEPFAVYGEGFGDLDKKNYWQAPL